MLSVIEIRNELAAIQDRLHVLKSDLDRLLVEADDHAWRARCSERINIGTDVIRSAQIGIEVGWRLPDQEEHKANG
jgi:hypothetical protein